MQDAPVIFPKMQRLRNFLPAEVHDALLELAISAEGSFKETTVYAGDREVVGLAQRSSRKLQTDEWKPLFQPHIQDIAKDLFDLLGVKPRPVERYELELVASNDGDRFGSHLDTLTGKSRAAAGGGPARLISAVYYFHRLPRAFAGGELRIHPFTGDSTSTQPLDIDPEDNMLVAFPSMTMHEVLPVRCPNGTFADSRFSVNCWLLGTV